LSLWETSEERSALFVATITSFMGPLMISAVNVALPAIQADFKAGAVGLSWIATGYLLSMAVFLVPIGKIADIVGRKKVFVAGLIINTLAATLAAFVPGLAWLIVARVFQGIGAAMFVTTGMAILTSIFPPQRRGRVIGIYVAAVYVGLSVGPFVGGLLTQHLGWRSVFALMLPLGTVTVLMTLRYLKGEWADAAHERFDVTGSVLYAGAIFLLVFGAAHLPSLNGLLMVVGGLFGLAAFVRQEQRTVYPVFDLSLFRRNHIFAFSSLAALINYSATSALTFLLSLYLQYLKGLPPQIAGVVLMSQPMVMAILSPLAGRLSDRIEPRIPATVGMAMTALGLFFFIFLKAHTPIGLIVGNLVWIGAGFALFSSPNMNAIMGSVEKKHYGIASGTVATMRLLGQLISMALATVVLSIFIGHRPIEPSVFPLFVRSVQTCFAVSALLCALGVYFSIFRGKLKPGVSL
jgi:EmrB/QacA subfamily drug resistance transporter